MCVKMKQLALHYLGLLDGGRTPVLDVIDVDDLCAEFVLNSVPEGGKKYLTIVFNRS